MITLAIRTPLCKGKKGGFKDTTLEYLMYAILKAARERLGFSPDLVEDICMGNVCIAPISVGRGPFNNRAYIGI